ncbi:hypothetical protein F5Y00DRAFT_257916 [Daldinia vernicosa]|uniref:uncharacterized protein n=1 Tax=Daldinia vernicosa TaxID=114800 RepID=UPI0020085325|nr:uncharacterized protein F5Y00DRAFT_257916 [Daldinia vernicosa]KAI0853257.1 hypothetical protein F5Y00DRAFT_257916 [Daldinia vernicosa]
MSFLLLVGLIVLQLILPVSGVHGGSDIKPGGAKLNELSNAQLRAFTNLNRARSTWQSKNGTHAIASPCKGGFKKPTYKLSAFQFNKTGIEVGDRSMAHFVLHDIANNETTSCTTPYLQDPNKPMWNNCAGDKDAVTPKTIFKYTASASEVEINQMWICEVENKTHPLPYFSSAKADLTGLLDCVDDPTQTRCTVADEKISPFDGDYVTPVWNSDTMDIIPPSEKEVLGTPWNPTPCIGTSFSYPNWDVQNVTQGKGDDGTTLSFSLSNHANNQSTACTTKGGEWSTCDSDSTEVRFTEETSELAINQTWVCNGGDKYPKDVTFRAIGTAPIDIESKKSTYVKGSLTEPIELSPNVAPEGVNHPGCLETSEAPTWIVTSWVWNERWRNGYNAGDLTATFHNPSTGFNLTCTGDGEELNRDGRYGYERWWGCSLARSPFDDYRTISSIKLNPLTGVFSIDQRWYCNGNGDDNPPAKFRAVGNVDTSLDCSWNNNTATNTSTKTCHQTALPLTLRGTVTERTDLAQDAFFELPPEGYSCTIASVLSTQWQMGFSSDALYAAPTFADSLDTKVRFGIQFVAIDGFQGVAYEGLETTPYLPTSDPARWHECKDYIAGGQSSDAWARQSLDCKWQLDLATGYIAMNHTWFCDDKDPENPIIFTGSGSRFYDTSCYVYRGDDEISCHLVGLNPPPVLPTYLSWKSVPAAELRAWD